MTSPSLLADYSDDSINAFIFELVHLTTGIPIDQLTNQDITRFLGDPLVPPVLSPPPPIDVSQYIAESSQLHGQEINEYIHENVPDHLRNQFRIERRRFIRRGYQERSQHAPRTRTRPSGETSGIITSADPAMLEIARLSMIEIPTRNRRALNQFMTRHGISIGTTQHALFVRIRGALNEQRRWRNMRYCT